MDRARLGARRRPGRQQARRARAARPGDQRRRPKRTHQQAQRVTVLLNKPIGYVSGQAEDGYEPAVVLVTAANHWRDDRSALRFPPRAPAPPRAGRPARHRLGRPAGADAGRAHRQAADRRGLEDREGVPRARALRRSRTGGARPAVGRAARRTTGAAAPRPRARRRAAASPRKVAWQNEDQLRFVLREGKKRQIRRMCELVGLKVTGLKRVRIGRVVLGDLPPGQWRYLGPFERF